MTVLDSGRETPYDFSHQSSYQACRYDVRWRAVLLRLVADVHSIAIAKAYLGAHTNQADHLMRLIRVQTWTSGLRLSILPPDLALLFDDYKLEVLLDYRELRETMFPGLHHGGKHPGVLDKSLVWDWAYVRNDLRKLFTIDPRTFVDIRRGIAYRSDRRGLHEERNYFIMLCDEETYVSHT